MFVKVHLKKQGTDLTKSWYMIKFQSSEIFTVQFSLGHGYVNTVNTNFQLC